MKPTTLFNSDDRAVSPVIGVILMVAITVILAAVIGTFVLGLGDSLGDSQPSAQLSVDVDESSSPAPVTVEHGGGDSIEANSLRVVVSNTSSSDQISGEIPSRLSVGDTISSSADGNSISIGEGTDYRVRIIHQPSDSILLDRTFQASETFDIEDLDLPR